MSSNSLILKSTIFPEWYTERIQPWYQSVPPSPPLSTVLRENSYVPVSTDYEDLLPIMSFFRGDLSGQGEHDELAKKLGAQGKEWSRNFWSWSDMQACELSYLSLSYFILFLSVLIFGFGGLIY